MALTWGLSMIADAWSTAAEQKVADALRAALDAAGVRIPPGAERRVIVHLLEQLAERGVHLP